MSQPLVSVIVPTVCRPSLTATLDSIATQLGAGLIEVVLVADTHNRQYSLIEKPPSTLKLANLQVAFHDAGLSAWGHPQRNWAMSKCHGLYICSLDDDDTWDPHAMVSLISNVSQAPHLLHIFRMRYADDGRLLWRDKKPELGNVGTPMMVVPNQPEALGVWGYVYEGDFTFLRTTMVNLGGESAIRWHSEVLAHIQPGGPPRD